MCSSGSPPVSFVTSGTDGMTGSDPKLGRLPWAVFPGPSIPGPGKTYCSPAGSSGSLLPTCSLRAGC